MFKKFTKCIVPAFLVMGAMTSANVNAAPPAQTKAPPSCSLKAPPAGALRKDSHAVALFMYPATIASDYTGCQSTWFEDGMLFTRFRFTNGALESAELNEPDEEPVKCHFRKGDKALDRPEFCRKAIEHFNKLGHPLSRR